MKLANLLLNKPRNIYDNLKKQNNKEKDLYLSDNQNKTVLDTHPSAIRERSKSDTPMTGRRKNLLNANHKTSRSHTSSSVANKSHKSQDDNNQHDNNNKHTPSVNLYLDMPLIDRESIFHDQKIGHGCFGSVHKAIWQGKTVAVKQFKKFKDFQNEVKIASKIKRHEYIVDFYGVVVDEKDQYYCLIMEYCPNGSFQDIISRRHARFNLTLLERLDMLIQVTEALDHLHNNCNIVMRDLKPDNILITEKKSIKLCDFGLSEILWAETAIDDKARGTPVYLAPEILLIQPHNELSDIYAMGLVIWSFLTLTAPYSHHQDFKKFRYHVCYIHERPLIPDNCPPALESLLLSTWDEDYKKRPTSLQVKSQLYEIKDFYLSKRVPGRA